MVIAGKELSGGIRTAGASSCAEWFTGKCEGEPLDVAPPWVGDLRPKGRGVDEDEKYNNWVKTRLREVWPLEVSTCAAGGLLMSERGNFRLQ